MLKKRLLKLRTKE